MTASLDVDKNDPAFVVSAIWDAVEGGEPEVLVDDVSRQVRGALSSPLTALYPQLGRSAQGES